MWNFRIEISARKSIYQNPQLKALFWNKLWAWVTASFSIFPLFLFILIINFCSLVETIHPNAEFNLRTIITCTCCGRVGMLVLSICHTEVRASGPGAISYPVNNSSSPKCSIPKLQTDYSKIHFLEINTFVNVFQWSKEINEAKCWIPYVIYQHAIKRNKDQDVTASNH